jgi:cytochrome c-type biogenesis protein CcmH
MIKFFQWVFLLGALCFCVGVRGEEARLLAEDPVAEARMQAIAGELRCLVCQNEALSASNADLANDLRQKIRTLIQEGKSDSDILDFMVERYGDFVRYRPPFRVTTAFLWLLPPVFVVVGILLLRRAVRLRALRARPPLSATEIALAEQLLVGDLPPATLTPADDGDVSAAPHPAP